MARMITGGEVPATLVFACDWAARVKEMPKIVELSAFVIFLRSIARAPAPYERRGIRCSMNQSRAIFALSR
jgi:hypothetical protein